MPNGKEKYYWLHEANRKLALALIGAKGKVRILIEEASTCLGLLENELHEKDGD